MRTDTYPAVRLSRMDRVLPSNVDKKTVEGETEVFLCNYTDVYYSELITSALPFMKATATEQQRAVFGLRSGDVIITKDSETADDIGVPAFVPETLENVVCGYHLSLIRVDSDQLLPEFLFWFMNSFSTRHRLGSLATGVTRYGVRLDAVQGLRLPLPPVGTQRSIVAELKLETARIDRAIEILGGSKNAADGSLPQLLVEEREAVIDDLLVGSLGGS